MIQACTYHSAMFVKPHQWPTPSESIAIYCVRKLVSCVTHLQWSLPHISDHYPIFCVVSLSKSFHRVAKVTFRDRQKFSIENFLSELQITLSNMPSSEDVNSSLSTLLTSFENVLKKHAPLKTLSKRQEHTKSKPWLTKGLLRSIRTKNKLYTNLRKKSAQDDHKWADFRKHRNKLNHLIEKSKVNCYMQQIASSNNNSSLMWKTIKNILNKRHKNKYTYRIFKWYTDKA